jgi:hypothetical protein
MKVLAELVERVFGCLALEVAQVVDRAALHGRRRPRPAQPRRRPGLPSMIARSGARARGLASPRRKSLQASLDSLPHSSSASNALRPSASTATAVSTGTLATLPALRTRTHTASR